MTVHSIEIVSANTQATDPNNSPAVGNPPDMITAVQDRVSQTLKQNHTEVLEAQNSPESEVTAGVDGTGTTHIRGQRRFDKVDSKAAVLDTVEQEVVGDAEWYEVRYHDCTHDGTGGACGDWTVERSYGTVPSDV